MKRHVSWCVIVKNKSRKRSQKQNKRKSKKGSNREKLNSGDSDVIDNVNVEALSKPSVRQVRWLTKMAKSHCNSARMSRFHGRKGGRTGGR